MYGKVLSDFSKEKLVSLTNDKDLDIGLIIENTATRLMRFLKNLQLNIVSIILMLHKLKVIMMILYTLFLIMT